MYLQSFSYVDKKKDKLQNATLLAYCSFQSFRSLVVFAFDSGHLKRQEKITCFAIFLPDRFYQRIGTVFYHIYLFVQSDHIFKFFQHKLTFQRTGTLKAEDRKSRT